MTLARRGLTSLVALAVGLSMQAVVPPSPAVAAPHKAEPKTLADLTGLSVSIDSIDPSVLMPGDRLKVAGAVSNDSDHTWSDAKVYLEMSAIPATTKGELDDFALTDEENFGERIVAIGYFDEIGAVRPGQRTRYRLSLPYAQLPIHGGPGVYHIAVAVLASEAGVRDENADARTDALLPVEDPDAPPRQQATVTTLIPVTAPVPRQSDGAFASDLLAPEVSLGGRLRNLLDFVLAAPPDSLDLVVDPALLDGLRAMADGYDVVNLADGPDATPRPGTGEQAADAWLSAFGRAADAQNVDFLPWGNTNTSGMTSAGMPHVAEAAFRASQQFASQSAWPTAPVVDWQNNGGSTHRGLSVARHAGATEHVVSQGTLTRLQPEDDNGYPPALATVNTRSVPLTTTVTRSDVAGEPWDKSTSALQFRQQVLAEAMVRAMSSTLNPSIVVAAPFHWNPSALPAGLDLASAYHADFVAPLSLGALNLNAGASQEPVSYDGPVETTAPQPAMATDLESAIQRLRDYGRVYTALLTDGHNAEVTFDQELALAASFTWLWHPKRGATIIRRSARAMGSQIKKVTVTGPEFVALSSASGRFPLTVSNGLDVSVTVTVSVVPRNPALRIEPIDPIVLDPGQRRVVEVQSRAAGSGVTSVRARLATVAHRPFGRPWDFDIRATRIGVAIWVLLGVLIATLFSGAAVRIVRRIRGGGFRPRGQRLG